MRLFRYATAVALLLCAQGAHAQVKQIQDIPCEGCSYAQMQAAALSDVDVGGALVTSISTGEIRKFVILWDRRIQELPIEQDLEDYFVALVRFWHANGRSLEMNYDVASNTWRLPQQAMATARVRRALAAPAADRPVPATVYDALQSPARMNNAIEQLNASWLARGYAAHMTFVNSVRGKNISLTAGRPVTTLNFADGSSIKASYDIEMKSWAPIPGTGLDVHGNPVPETKADVAKDGKPVMYEFPGGITSDAYMDFSRYLFDLGVRPNIGPGDNQMICTSEVMDADMRVEVRCMGRRH